MLFKPQKELLAKEEDIGLDAAHAPQDVMKFYPFMFRFLPFNKGLDHFLPAFAKLVGKGRKDRLSDPSARGPQVSSGGENVNRGVIQGAEKEGLRPRGHSDTKSGETQAPSAHEEDQEEDGEERVSSQTK